MLFVIIKWSPSICRYPISHPIALLLRSEIDGEPLLPALRTILELPVFLVILIAISAFELIDRGLLGNDVPMPNLLFVLSQNKFELSSVVLLVHSI